MATHEMSHLVLMVDPCKKARKEIAKAISGNGREVIQASNIDEAIDSCGNKSPSVVIIREAYQTAMPKIYEWVRAACVAYPQTPIVAIGLNEAQKQNCMACGATEYYVYSTFLTLRDFKRVL